MKNGIKHQDFQVDGAGQPAPGNLSTLPAKVPYSLNFNNQPVESRITWAET
jgi:hypothetical protein